MEKHSYFHWLRHIPNLTLDEEIRYQEEAFAAEGRDINGKLLIQALTELSRRMARARRKNRRKLRRLQKEKNL